MDYIFHFPVRAAGGQWLVLFNECSGNSEGYCSVRRSEFKLHTDMHIWDCGD